MVFERNWLKNIIFYTVELAHTICMFRLEKRLFLFVWRNIYYKLLPPHLILKYILHCQLETFLKRLIYGNGQIWPTTESLVPLWTSPGCIHRSLFCKSYRGLNANIFCPCHLLKSCFPSNFTYSMLWRVFLMTQIWPERNQVKIG